MLCLYIEFKAFRAAYLVTRDSCTAQNNNKRLLLVQTLDLSAQFVDLLKQKEYK